MRISIVPSRNENVASRIAVLMADAEALRVPDSVASIHAALSAKAAERASANENLLQLFAADREQDLRKSSNETVRYQKMVEQIDEDARKYSARLNAALENFAPVFLERAASITAPAVEAIEEAMTPLQDAIVVLIRVASFARANGLPLNRAMRAAATLLDVLAEMRLVIRTR